MANHPPYKHSFVLVVLVTINENFFIFILFKKVFIVITPILKKICARNANFCKKVYFLRKTIKNIKMIEVKSAYLKGFEIKDYPPQMRRIGDYFLVGGYIFQLLSTFQSIGWQDIQIFSFCG